MRRSAQCAWRAWVGNALCDALCCVQGAVQCAWRAWVGEADLPLERVGEEVGRAEGLVERRHREGVGPAEACSTQGELKVMAGLKGLGQPKPAQG